MGEEQPGGGGGGSRLMKSPKEIGERILAPTRRPDGTLRKPIRIRAGYVPQDEVAIYQSKGAIIMKKGTQPEVPPGYDPVHADAADGKPKTKSAKRNERKKEKKLQAALASTDKGKDLDSEQADNLTSEVPCAKTLERLQSVETVTDKISNLSVSATSVVASPSTDQIEMSKSEESGPDIDKRIRALKKKIRLAEAQLQGDEQHMKPEHLEKMTKVEGWRGELKVLEDKKANRFPDIVK